jgi:hypothetical protein
MLKLLPVSDGICVIEMALKGQSLTFLRSVEA